MRRFASLFSTSLFLSVCLFLARGWRGRGWARVGACVCVPCVVRQGRHAVRRRERKKNSECRGRDGPSLSPFRTFFQRRPGRRVLFALVAIGGWAPRLPQPTPPRGRHTDTAWRPRAHGGRGALKKGRAAAAWRGRSRAAAWSPLSLLSAPRALSLTSLSLSLSLPHKHIQR